MLLEIWGFDNAEGGRQDAIFDALTDRAVVGESNGFGTYQADGLVAMDFCRRPLSTGFRIHIALWDLAAAASEIIMGADIRPMDNPLGGPNNIWAADFLEAGFGPVIPPATPLTIVAEDRKWIATLDQADGKIRFCRGRTNENFDWMTWGGGTTLLGQTVPGIVAPGEAWAHYEFRLDLATDSILVRKNYAQIFSQAGVGMGGGTFSRAGWTRNCLAVTESPSLDNMYVLSTAGGVRTTYIPNARVASYLPSSDAGPNTWTPNIPGPNWVMLSEFVGGPLPPPMFNCHDQDVTYAASAVAGQRDMYRITPGPIPTLGIMGVQFYAYFQALGGVDATVNLVATSPGAVDYVYGPFTIPFGYINPGDATVIYRGIRSAALEVDPETGLDWTDARLALWSFGFENVAGTSVRATQLFVSKLMGTPAAPPAPPAAPAVAASPGALQLRRGKPQVRCGNVWDWCLENDKRLWAGVDWTRLLPRLPRCWRDIDNPLHRIPEEGREFHKYGAIGVPAAPSVDTQIFQFRVPLGYDGILYGVLCKYVGPGFVNGSGDLIWRFQMNRRWIKSLHTVPAELGDFTGYAQLDEFVRVRSGQTIRAFGWLSPLSGIVPGPDKRVIAAVQGWFYPMELSR